MKNQNNTPQPTAQDILDAKQDGWEVCANAATVVAVTECGVWTANDDEFFSFDYPEFGFAKDEQRLVWPEYYTLHSLSRPFKPEEWGWEPIIVDPETGEMVKGPAPEGQTEWMCNNPNISMEMVGKDCHMVWEFRDSAVFTIPTARDYITLAKILGIEVLPTNQNNNG